MTGSPTLVAEIGCNHKGSAQIAMEMVKEAAMCGADIVKFQRRHPSLCLRPEIYSGPHPNPVNSYGATYGEHREFLELDLPVHYQLYEYCLQHNVAYSCTPFDLISAEEIVKLNPQHLKISSFHNNHTSLIEYICTSFPGTIHISLGMTTNSEEMALIEILRAHDRLKHTVLYWCTSAYPARPADLSLLEIRSLIEKYGHELQAVGYSGHHEGIAMDLIAFTLGATYFERHFTLNHNWKGTDHKASLMPEGLTKLTRDLRSARQALAFKSCEIIDAELHNRKFHKFSG
ncbi:N-acetylneuraminate synthase family protein [Synechococcus sp. BS55D]|uniref:N-acetylneuraminate synthase family protein n=1 Tax=Synechococcus sp. BS55D TaxID=2055943 RepID=UPI00103F77F3|nr:N-acetylneuraminate synthase family protein [Synechococcus sp. BS55D]TCD58092.1 N-acetylneuraminate synthase [Synechococcus sp. BS55D]